MSLKSINPATGETLKTFDVLTDAEIEARIGKAFDAFRDYRLTSFAQRAENMVRAAELLEKKPLKKANGAKKNSRRLLFFQRLKTVDPRT